MPRRHGSGEPSEIPHQHDRRRPRLEQGDLGLGHLEQPPCSLHIGGHHRERLVGAGLPPAEFRNRVFVRSVAGEVEPAEPLQGHDLATSQPRSGFAHRVAPGRRPAGSEQRQTRPAGGTSDRLCVEPPISGIQILARAVRAHREHAHAGSFAVVREPFDDREPGPAVRAVDERIPEAAISWIEQLAQASLARGDVGRDEPVTALADPALHDREPVEPLGWNWSPPDLLDPSERRRLTRDRRTEPFEYGRLRFCVDPHDAGVVADPSPNPKAVRESPYERPEADALDYASDLDLASGRLSRTPGRDPGHRRPPIHPYVCHRGRVRSNKGGSQDPRERGPYVPGRLPRCPCRPRSRTELRTKGRSAGAPPRRRA